MVLILYTHQNNLSKENTWLSFSYKHYRLYCHSLIFGDRKVGESLREYGIMTDFTGKMFCDFVMNTHLLMHMKIPCHWFQILIDNPSFVWTTDLADDASREISDWCRRQKWMCRTRDPPCLWKGSANETVTFFILCITNTEICVCVHVFAFFKTSLQLTFK